MLGHSLSNPEQLEPESPVDGMSGAPPGSCGNKAPPGRAEMRARHQAARDKTLSARHA